MENVTQQFIDTGHLDETSICLMTGSPIHQHRKISLEFSNRMCERHKNSFYINKGITPWVCGKRRQAYPRVMTSRKTSGETMLWFMQFTRKLGISQRNTLTIFQFRQSFQSGSV